VKICGGLKVEIENINYGDEFVLVVDDEESVREPVVAMLEYLGFKADSAVSGEEALELLTNRPYTFLLTDIRMSGIDGLELIKRTKRSHPEICAIAMTGYSREFNYVEVINTGATDFVNKPFVIEELEAKMKRAIIERNIRQELQRLSITDSLTDLYNQRHFYARLNEEIARTRRQKHDLALILLDLDDFKQYNDKHGHLAGDELLQNVGKVINGNVRQGVDLGFRYGGDEFAVLLIDADEVIAGMMSARIEKGIEEECGITASTGSVIFSDNLTAETLVEEADRRLYGSKEQKNNLKGLKKEVV
jgi:two-component system, cell cycle response regulator